MARINGRRMVRIAGEWIDYEERVANLTRNILGILEDGVEKTRRQIGGLTAMREEARLLDTALRRLERSGRVASTSPPRWDRRSGRRWRLIDPVVEARKREELERSRRYAADHFGVPLDEVDWYHGGICYSSVVVTTQTAVDRVREKVKGETVNGGWFHGSPLGQVSETKTKDGRAAFRVTC